MAVNTQEKRKMTVKEASRKGGEKVAKGHRILQGNRQKERREGARAAWLRIF